MACRDPEVHPAARFACFGLEGLKGFLLMNEDPRADNKPSLCFVALNAYNLLSGREDIGHSGGAQVQQFQIASWLASRGFLVSFVTLDHGQPDGINIHGIRVFKAYAQEDGIRGLRFVHPRWSGLWAAMARADADVYYQRRADSETGQVALWCRRHRRKFVFSAGSNADCDPQLSQLRSLREKILSRVGMRLAHATIAQTLTQQRLLRQNMKLSTILVRNCRAKSTGDSSCEESSAIHSRASRVLWVGRISREKRFEWLLDVAEQCSEVSFDVVGASNTDSEYSSFLTKRAAGISNVKMHGRVPYAQMSQYYKNCHVLCCTSVYEGFPNTFLEAWSLGVPVVSTFDPDSVIAANGLGSVASDVKGIVACLKQFIQSPETWLRASQAANQYYAANHTPEKCLPVFERLILEVVGHPSEMPVSEAKS